MKTNTSTDIEARKFNGQFFGFTTYAEKAETIHAHKADFASVVAAMDNATLEAATIDAKTVQARLSDPVEVLWAEMKARAEAGTVFKHYELETYPKAGAVDWVAIGKALGITKTEARERFAPTKQITALKPKA